MVEIFQVVLLMYNLYYTWCRIVEEKNVEHRNERKTTGHPLNIFHLLNQESLSLRQHTRQLQAS